MVNVDSMLRLFRERFPGETPTALVRAPGRVNLIGEHVDYNGGLVLPMAIDLATYAVEGKRTDERVVVFSSATTECIEIELEQIGPPMTGWGAYVQGVVAELQRFGVPLRGADIILDGDLPPGSGLSSSAALEVAIALSLLQASEMTLKPEEIAKICRETENEWVHVPCGIMDQLACLLGRSSHVMLIDCQSEETRHIRWPDEKFAVFIVDSKSPHRLSAGLYAERVHECKKALHDIDWLDLPDYPDSLRDIPLGRLEPMVDYIERAVFRRARHVITEIGRVKDAVQAIEAADFRRLGELMNESHRSLALDYDVSSPRMDDLAETVRRVSGVYGARLTGAGFGGCVVAVGEVDALAGIEAAVRARYDPKYGVTAPVWAVRPAAGASVQEI